MALMQKTFALILSNIYYTLLKITDGSAAKNVCIAANFFHHSRGDNA